MRGSSSEQGEGVKRTGGAPAFSSYSRMNAPISSHFSQYLNKNRPLQITGIEPLRLLSRLQASPPIPTLDLSGADDDGPRCSGGASDSTSLEAGGADETRSLVKGLWDDAHDPVQQPVPARLRSDGTACRTARQGCGWLSTL